jgi:hypothetical protein
MCMLLLICLLVGAVLGQRFKVIALIPALALAITATAGITHGGTFWQILGAAFAATTSLQIGYLAGAVIRLLMAASRASRKRAKSHTALPSRSMLQIGKI